MPAYFDTGFSVRLPMWHGEGDVLDAYPTDWADARVKAGLTWEPTITEAAAIVRPDQVGALDRSRILAVLPDGRMVLGDPDHRSILRNDTGAVLGSGVGTDYTPVLNGVLGEIAEALEGAAAGTLRFETAGAVKGGEGVWCLVYLDEPYRVAGDDSDTLPFLAITNWNNGSGSLRCNFTNVRIVCWNTMQAAIMEGERSGRQFVFRHSGNVMDRVEEAKQALAGAREDAAEWQQLAADLYDLNVDDRQVNHFLSEFIPMPEADVISDRVRGNIERSRDLFRHTYMDSVTCEAHRGTALGLVDAGTEYLDHLRGFRNRDTYLGRTMLRPEPMKAKLVNLARAASGF